MKDIDNKSPYVKNNYFSQEWPSGTLSNFSDKTIYVDEIKNPTDNNEKTYANVLQNYYIYRPININEDSIMNLTSFYIPNPELFNILEVFKPLDQGHDFYTSGRNVSGNWTLPSYYDFNNKEIVSYNQFQANTSFGGGYNIFGLICIEEDSYNFLKQNNDILDVNNLLNIITGYSDQDGNKLNIYETFKCKYGTKFNFNLNKNNKLQINDITNNTEIPDNKNGDIIFLSLYTSDIYNNGMHSLWNFIKPTYVYAVNILPNSSPDNLLFKGYLLYKSNIVVPELHISIQNILDKYVENNTELKSLINEKGNKLYKTLVKKILDKEEFINDINKIIINKNNGFDIDLERGYTLIFTDFKVEDKDNFVYPKEVKNLLITFLLKYYNSKLLPKITEHYKPFIERNNKIIQSQPTGSVDNIYKIPVSIIDANPSPNESSLIQSLRNMKDEDDFFKYPYKYSIVSINVDGSGLGGQISTSYHPPEISIYMTVFDKDNNFGGFIYRICFLNKINSNILNSKSQIEVDMHFCFFNINDIKQYIINNTDSYKGDDLNKIKNISSKVTEFILKNTKIDENMIIRTKINPTDLVGKAWYKFVLESDAPSVLNINKAVKDIEKAIKINRDNIQVGQKSNDVKNSMLSNFGNSISNVVSSIASNIYNSIALNSESKDPNSLNNLITTAIKIYWSDGFLQSIFPDINNFVRIFLIRNKYIGDNSRATDTLYYNKEAVIDPIQMSNDVNTLSTAKLVNVSSILASPASSERNYFISPYLTSENKYITSKNTEQKEEEELVILGKNQDSIENSNKPKGVKRKLNIFDYGSRVTRSSLRGGRYVDISQPLPQDIINRSIQKDKSIMSSPLIQQKIVTQGAPSSPPSSSPSSTPSSSMPSYSPSTISESEHNEIPIQDTYLNNLVNYLKNVKESIEYVNSTYTESYQNEHVNDFIIKLYLSNIKQNISSFSKGLTIESLINILDTYINKPNPSLNEGLYIKNIYNSIFRNFDQIQNLISSAIDIEQEEDILSYENEFINEDINEDETEIGSENIQQGGTIAKRTFESINTKFENLFNFTQNRVDILNECLKNNQSIINTINNYNSIILKLYDYLVGYYNDIYSLDECDINGMNAFIGIYCFFMYFTIEFNRQLNNTPEINPSLNESDKNILQQIFAGNELLSWIVNFYNGNQELFQGKEITLNYREINNTMKGLPYNEFMKNDTKYMLNILNNLINNSIFIKRSDIREQKFQIITGIKSLYFLLDDNFIENYINNYNVDELKNITSEQFMNLLFDNNLYGLLVDIKYKYFINNDEIKNTISDLLYFKQQQTLENVNINMDNSQYDSDKMNISDVGGTKKNRRVNKKHKTKNNNRSHKNKTNKNKRSIKKRGKKIRRNTIKK